MFNSTILFKAAILDFLLVDKTLMFINAFEMYKPQ